MVNARSDLKLVTFDVDLESYFRIFQFRLYILNSLT